MNKKESDEWETPQWLFDKLNKEFNFDIDACDTKSNTKCKMYCDDFLNDEAPAINVKLKWRVPEGSNGPSFDVAIVVLRGSKDDSPSN